MNKAGRRREQKTQARVEPRHEKTERVSFDFRVFAAVLDVSEQEMDEVFEAGFQVDGFQYDLAFGRFGKEGAGDQIRELAWVIQFCEVLNHVFDGSNRRGIARFAVHPAQLLQDMDRKIESQVEPFGDQFQNFRGQGVDGDAFGAGCLEGANSLDAVRLVANGLGQLDPGNSLKDQVRGAIGIANGSADESQTSDGGGSLAGSPWLLHGDREHAVRVEGIRQHLPVAGFEDVEREHGLGKEDGVGQRHHGKFARQFHEYNLGVSVGNSRQDVAGTCCFSVAALDSLKTDF